MYVYLRDQSKYGYGAELGPQYEADAVIAGNAYIVETVFSIGASSTVNVIVDPTVLSNQRFTVLPTSWGVSASHIKITLGTCTAYSAGTAVTCLNRNYKYSNADTVVKTNATVAGATDSGVEFIVGAEGQGANLGGGNYGAGGMQILDPTAIYYFKVVNQEATIAKVTANIKFFETSINQTLGY